MSSQKSYKNSRSKNTQIQYPDNYDLSNLIFDDPVEGTIPNSKLLFYKINIGTKNPNGSEGDLVFVLERSSTFGIKESRDPSQNLIGYSMGIILYDRDNGQDEYQRKVTETFNELVEKCKDFILRDDILKKMKKSSSTMKRDKLDNISPLYFTKDKETNEPQPDKPILNVKLLYRKERSNDDGSMSEAKVTTRLYIEDEVDENGEPLEYESLSDVLDKKGFVRPAIKFESIFLGKDIKIQVKVLEAELKIEEKSTKRRLLPFGIFNKKKEIEDEITIEANYTEQVEEIQVQTNQLSISDNEEEEKPRKVTKKKVKN